jgi:HAMP domain-containing protein
MNNQEKLKRLKWLMLQLRVKEDELRNICRRYPQGNSMTAYLRVASHSLDEPPSQNEALELAKAIHRLRQQIEELKRELDMAA